jgi:hypothetical protein
VRPGSVVSIGLIEFGCGGQKKQDFVEGIIVQRATIFFIFFILVSMAV